MYARVEETVANLQKALTPDGVALGSNHIASASLINARFFAQGRVRPMFAASDLNCTDARSIVRCVGTQNLYGKRGKIAIALGSARSRELLIRLWCFLFATCVKWLSEILDCETNEVRFGALRREHNIGLNKELLNLGGRETDVLCTCVKCPYSCAPANGWRRFEKQLGYFQEAKKSRIDDHTKRGGLAIESLSLERYRLRLSGPPDRPIRRPELVLVQFNSAL
jgi:hypothetical protein